MTRRISFTVSLALLAFYISACAGHDGVRKQVFKGRGDISVQASISSPRTGATYKKAKKSKPYSINGIKYYPIGNADGFSQKGTASWYGPDFHGKKTANGETYDQMDMTAAHKTLPFNTILNVHSYDSGRSIQVRVNDRGPFVGRRIIDLSKKAAIKIGMIKSGTARVKITSVTGRRFQQRSPRRFAEKKRTAVKAEPAAAKKNKSANDNYYVQVASFSDPQRAEKMSKNFKSDYGKVTIKEKVFYSGTLHRVLLGPFDSREAAETAKAGMKAGGTFIVANP